MFLIIDYFTTVYKWQRDNVKMVACSDEPAALTQPRDTSDELNHLRIQWVAEVWVWVTCRGMPVYEPSRFPIQRVAMWTTWLS